MRVERGKGGERASSAVIAHVEVRETSDDETVFTGDVSEKVSGGVLLFASSDILFSQ